MKSILQNSQLDANSVVAALAELMMQGEPQGVEGISLWGAPTLDFTVTALSLRAGMLGARDGRALYHHELRRRVCMPPEGEPEIEVWGGGTVPEWEDGVLVEPKYFSFFQDSPFAAFNPNHRRKWRAHEMLHGAVGFFWRPDMSRFEFYLGSRLNELLPVVHWYGLDEAFRPRCANHQGQALSQQYCPACESAAIPYWEHSEEFMKERRSSAVQHVEDALTHFKAEMAVCRQEIEETRAIENRINNINASSDAAGYMRAHWNRCTSWSFGTWAERYLIEGQDYVDTVGALADRVDRVLGELIGGEIEVQNYESRIGRRRVLDHVGRVLRAIEVHEFKYEDHFADLLDAAEPLTQTIEPDVSDISNWEDELSTLCHAIEWQDILSTGMSSSEDALAFVLEGIETIPSDHPIELSGSEAADFVDSSNFMQHGRLVNRLGDWMKSVDHPQAAMVSFNAWLEADPRVDEEFERFGAVSEGDLSNGHLRANTTLRRDTLDGEILGAPGEKLDVVVVYVSGEARVVILDDSLAAALDEPGDNPATHQLLELGILVFFPRVQ